MSSWIRNFTPPFEGSVIFSNKQKRHNSFHIVDKYRREPWDVWYIEAKIFKGNPNGF